jgi:enamine deaminase RidA (YjgF/YER057c/UK114 family)
MPELQRTVINPDQLARPLGAYSQAISVKANELVFIAGQVSVDISGNIVGKGDAYAQTKQIYDNIGKALEHIGATFSNVVELTTFLVGRETYEPYSRARAEVFAEVFPNSDYPPNTLLIISGLAREEFLVEIKAIAAL